MNWGQILKCNIPSIVKGTAPRRGPRIRVRRRPAVAHRDRPVTRASTAPVPSTCGRRRSRTPPKLYRPSTRPYRGLTDLEYPFHDKAITVTQCGRICFERKKVNLSTVFAGQKVGVKQVDDKIWLVSFMQYDLGFFDHETGRLESVQNPFEARVLPMSKV